MADFAFGNDEETIELRKLNAEVLADPDSFENWEKLVRAAETLEGGLNRNSSPQSISAARHVYDKFLARFPLFFGYWKKYADVEFAIAGTESAEFIYERGIASVTTSVDLWTHYCNFKVETCHDADVIRELFERAADSIGLDFLAHPFWDKYLEFEDRLEQHDRIFAILGRIIHIPMHQFARYSDRYQAMARTRPLTDVAPPDILEQFTAESTRIVQLRGGGLQDIERETWTKMHQYFLDTANKTHEETTKRWTFEQEIKRPYFHVTDLDDQQLANWHKYLDFEEAEGNVRRITFLYERCLVAAAQYEDFWQRYARFMYAQDGKVEDTRNVYQRASCFYTAIAQPEVRMQWAMFEESCGRPAVAAAIYDAILVVMPDYREAIVRLANLQLRQQGVDAAVDVYRITLDGGNCSSQTKGALVAEMARLMYHCGGDADKARHVFRQYQDSVLDSEAFWSGWLDFEAGLPVDGEGHQQTKHLARVRNVHGAIRETSRLDVEQVRALSHRYMNFLSERGGKEAAREYMETDALVNGSASVVPVMQSKLALRGGGGSVVGDELGGKSGNMVVKVNGH